MLVGSQYFTKLASADIFAGVTEDGLDRWHIAVGPAILVVMAIRLVWRLTHRPPPPPSDLPSVVRRIAILTNWAFYALLILIPVVGWISTSKLGERPSLLFLMKLPLLASANMHAGEWWGAIHGWLADLLLVLIGVHIAAAMWHGLARDDGVFARMMPRRQSTTTEGK